ncbi:hypothetical protein S40293_11180 [Stachybotrys chartarum IBT 40293]|nr:hypothetical protein S40293_11180 [Stachybotrys chartarum IBT 40293]
MAPALGKQPNLHIAPSSQVTRTTAATSSPDTKAHFLRNGHRIAAGYIVAAVLVNHIRRVLAPWFGQFVWRHALEYMKLARSSPHYHLDISLDYEWRGVLYFVAQQYALSLTRRVLTEKLARDARGTGGSGEGVRGLVLGGGADVCVCEGAGVGERGRAGVCAAGAGREVASSTGSSCGIRVLAGGDCSTNVEECGEGGEEGPRGVADGLGNDVLRDGISGAVLEQVLYAARDERDVGDVGVDGAGGGICLGAESLEVVFEIVTRVWF